MNGELRLLITSLLGYVEFGLSIYAGSGVVGLLWLRFSKKSPALILRDLMQIYFCLLGFMVLDGVRALWDGTHEERFPVIVSFVLLPILYWLIGDAAFRLKRNHKEWFENSNSISKNENKNTDHPTPLGNSGDGDPLDNGLRHTVCPS